MDNIYDVSIIIPAFNAEKTLLDALASAQNQTIKNIEILVIDDGSTDNTRYICSEISNFDKRVKYIYQENSGVSAARNVGIRKATGKYLFFLDSDDRMQKDALELLIKMANRYDNCLVCGSYKMIKSRGRSEDYILENCCIDVKNSCSSITGNIEKISYAPWGKMFSRKTILENEILFPYNIPYGEDGIFFLRYLEHVDKIVSISNLVYFYNFTNANSAARKYYKDYYRYMKILADEKIDLYHSWNINIDKQIIYQSYFDRACRHYIIHESQKSELFSLIKQSAKTFDVENKDKFTNQYLEKYVSTWKMNHFKDFIFERIKIILKI